MIVCKRCGYKNQDDDADFCASCGRFLEWSGEKVEAPVEAAAPAEEEDEAGRRGFIERVEGWVREQRGSAAGEPPAGEGSVLVAEDERASSAAPATAAAADAGEPGAPPPVAGPAVPGPAVPGPAVPAAGTPEAPPAAAAAEEPTQVFGPVLPTAAEEGEPAAAAGPATPGVAPAEGERTESADEDFGAPAKPIVPADPLLSAYIASPVAVVPAIDEPPKEVFKPDLGGTDGPGRREAAPERQPGKPIEKEVFRPAQYSKEITGPSRVVRDGDIVCPRCGQGNYPWRNYCRRCGLVLEHVKASTERHGPWAWLWGTLSSPVHRHRRRLVRAGERPGRHLRSSPKARGSMKRFHAPQVNKHKLGRVMAGVAVVALCFGAFGPFKNSFHSTTSRWWHDLQSTVDINYVAQYPVSVTAKSSAPKNGPENANDNNLATFWSSYAPQPAPKKKSSTSGSTTKGKGGTTTTTTTTTTTVPKKKSTAKPKKVTGVGQWLTLDFSQPENIGGFALFTGAQDSSADFTAYEKPKRIELIFSSAPPLFYNVSEAKTLQSWKFIHPSTTFLKIVITEVYPANTGTTQTKEEVAISDVFAYTRT